jgi:four helix bundle protein
VSSFQNELQLQRSDRLAKAVAMVTEVYRATKSFPKDETYGLSSQLRRSAVSVASNIAEGQGRISKPEFRQFLGMARGSLIEMETQIVIANNLGYVSHETAERLAACGLPLARAK